MEEVIQTEQIRNPLPPPRLPVPVEVPYDEILEDDDLDEPLAKLPPPPVEEVREEEPKPDLIGGLAGL